MELVYVCVKFVYSGKVVRDARLISVFSTSKYMYEISYRYIINNKLFHNVGEYVLTCS